MPAGSQLLEPQGLNTRLVGALSTRGGFLSPELPVGSLVGPGETEPLGAQEGHPQPGLGEAGLGPLPQAGWVGSQSQPCCRGGW